MRNRIRNVESLAARKSEITDRLQVSPIRTGICNLHYAEPLYFTSWRPVLTTNAQLRLCCQNRPANIE